MRWTRSLIPTLRDDPADAEAISHKLMVRAGLVPVGVDCDPATLVCSCPVDLESVGVAECLGLG